MAHPHSVTRATFIVDKTFMVSRMILNPVQQPISKKYSHALRHTRYFHLRQKRLETRWDSASQTAIVGKSSSHTLRHTRSFVGAKRVRRPGLILPMSKLNPKAITLSSQDIILAQLTHFDMRRCILKDLLTCIFGIWLVYVGYNSHTEFLLSGSLSTAGTLDRQG